MYWIYILSNSRKNVYYTGFTNDLSRRLYEHREKLFPGFTEKYNCHVLLYFEEVEGLEEAKHREKQIKRYKRDWKENLINMINPDRIDLTYLFPFDEIPAQGRESGTSS